MRKLIAVCRTALCRGNLWRETFDTFRRIDRGGFRKSGLAGVGILLMLLAIAVSARAVDGPVMGTTPNGPEGCACIGKVGNVNCDYRDEVSLVDVSMLIDHLYISGVRLPSREEANANGDPAGEISLGDVVALINFLFIDGTPLPDCAKPYNNPPDTRFVGFLEGVPFINSVAPMGASTGVRLGWTARDLIDHAYDDPEFAFEWRIFGPYTDTEVDQVWRTCVKRVFRTYDGRKFKLGRDTNIVLVCDTTWLPGGIREISCDTVILDTIHESNWLGWLDTLFDIESPEFAPYYRIVDSSWDGQSTWTYQTRDSMYDVFSNYPSDTTQRSKFIALVRARDPLDSTVCDPTPAFKTLSVINPKHERDVMIIDWGFAAAENRARPSSVKAFWNTALQNWIGGLESPGGVEFALSRDWKNILDYVETAQTGRVELLLTDALRHKLVILLQDIPICGNWSSQGQEARTIFAAIDAGVGAWVVAQVPIGTPVFLSGPRTYLASSTYQYYFGVSRYRFPGWGSFLYTDTHYGLPRVEDFVGATSLDSLRWPNLAIDTALLHTRYVWEGCVPSPSCYTDPNCNPNDCYPFYPFSDDDFAFLGALPQIGWVEPTADAEVMYTFKSLYGPVHPMFPELSFDGLPVMHRLDRGTFRTVHSCFSPLAMQSAGAQQMIDSVLNWLMYFPAPGARPEPVPAVEERGKVR